MPFSSWLGSVDARIAAASWDFSGAGGEDETRLRKQNFGARYWRWLSTSLDLWRHLRYHRSTSCAFWASLMLNQWIEYGTWMQVLNVGRAVLHQRGIHLHFAGVQRMLTHFGFRHGGWSVFFISRFCFFRKTRSDTRQSSRGRLGRSSNAKTAQNSKNVTDGRTYGPTDRHGKM